MSSTGAWRVDVGKGKRAYTAKYSFDNEAQARAWYRGINVHSGYKKRLVSPDGKTKERVLT